MVCQTCGTDYSGIYTPEVGHRVRVTFEGVVDKETPFGEYAIQPDRGGMLFFPPANATFERLSDPEPEWQTGDVVLDVEGWAYLRTGGGNWRNFHGNPWEPTRPLTLIARGGKPVTP